MATFPILTSDGDTIVTADGFAVVVEGGSPTPPSTAQTALIFSTSVPTADAAVVNLQDATLITTLGLPGTADAAILPTVNGGYFSILNSQTFGSEIVEIYNPDYTLFATAPGIPALMKYKSPINAANGHFYIGQKSDVPPKLYKYQADGTVLDNWTLLTGGTALGSMAVSNDETICYYSKATAQSAVLRYDLVARTGLTDLVAGRTGMVTLPNIFTIPGSTDIIVTYKLLSDGTTDAIRYTAAGAIVTTYTVGVSAGGTGHGALDPNQSTSWWMRYFPNADPTLTSTFVEFDIETGAVLDTVVVNQFSASPLVPDGVCPWLLFPATISNTTTYPIRRLRRFAL